MDDTALADAAQLISDEGTALVATITDPAIAESVQAFVDMTLEALAAMAAPVDAPAEEGVPG
jgi:hypothetical protein